MAIAIVNAAALERSLYLVAELLALDTPLVVGLNMSDVAEQHGIHVEPHVLEAALGVPVIPLVAARNEGIRELVAAAVGLAADPGSFQPNRPAIRPEHQPVLDQLVIMLDGCTCDRYAADWSAMKLLEGDSEVTAQVKASVSPDLWEEVHGMLLQHEDAYLDIAGGRYEWIGRMVRAAVTQPRAGAVTITDQIDRVATHPVLGLVLLLGIFGLAFALTYAIATPLSGWLSAVVLGGLTSLAQAVLGGAPAWVSGLVIDGLIGGAGTVLTFLPDPRDLLRIVGRARGCRVPVARRVRHGPVHAPDGAARQVVPAAVPRLRLQRAGRDGRAHPRGEKGPLSDDPARAARAVHRPARSARVPGPGLLWQGSGCRDASAWSR